MNGSPPKTAKCRICGGPLKYLTTKFTWRHSSKPLVDHPPIPDYE